MTDIEIPLKQERSRRYRFFEMLPGMLSWSILLLPAVLSFISLRLSVIFILSYLLLWFAKAVALNIRSVQGFHTLQRHQKLPWPAMLEELQTGQLPGPDVERPDWHRNHLERLQSEPLKIAPADIYHALIIATYNETRDVLEPTIQAVLNSEYDMQKVIVVIAYEKRGGPETSRLARDLIAEYRHNFRHAMAVEHPDDIPNEVVGKGGNITYAGRALQHWVDDQQMDPLKVVVTTLDSDNRPHPKYLSALSYIYALAPDPLHSSYQPIPVFTQNIWDVPAPMRVIAVSNTMWNVVLSLRPHMIRNFASHAQSLQTLIDTDFWSVRTIVEDGHQFWRSYFRYDGHHEVYPLYIPIYQDAVLSSTYIKTLKAQFVQLRRWAYGASDVAYVAEKGFFSPNKVPKFDLLLKFSRLLEGHVSWATSPLILAFAAFIPAMFNPDDFAANQLPIITSRIQTLALAGLFVTLYISFRLLPPKPARYKPHRTVFMVLQYALFPVTTILYSGMSGLYSQTRLMFGWYMDKFDVTDKAVVTDDNQRVASRETE